MTCKVLTGLFCGITILAHSQCTDLLATTKDRMTEATITSMKSKVIVVDSAREMALALYWVKLPTVTVLSIKAIGIGCVESGYVYFLFTDGTRKQLVHHSNFNCDGEADVWFGRRVGYIQPKHFTDFTSTPLKAIRVIGHQKVIEVELSESQALALLESARCMQML